MNLRWACLYLTVLPMTVALLLSPGHSAAQEPEVMNQTEIFELARIYSFRAKVRHAPQVKIMAMTVTVNGERLPMTIDGPQMLGGWQMWKATYNRPCNKSFRYRFEGAYINTRIPQNVQQQPGLVRVPSGDRFFGKEITVGGADGLLVKGEPTTMSPGEPRWFYMSGEISTSHSQDWDASAWNIDSITVQNLKSHVDRFESVAIQPMACPPGGGCGVGGGPEDVAYFEIQTPTMPVKLECTESFAFLVRYRAWLQGADATRTAVIVLKRTALPDVELVVQAKELNFVSDPFRPTSP